MHEHLTHGEPCKCGEHCQCGDKIHQYCKDEKCDHAEKLLKLADEAWMELLKEKIKDEIAKHKGAELEKLAQIAAKANGEKWKNKIAAKKECEEYKNTLKDYFTSK